jgi:hypothetical protein
MQRIIAAGAAVLLLAGCSQASPLEDLADGSCTGAVAALVDKHISGQIDALADKDWELAHSFASENFQANVSVDDFIVVINAQYGMLIENKGYEFNECAVVSNTIKQEVSVLSGEQEFSLTYNLTVKEFALGVESAVVSEFVSQLNI